MHMSLMNMHLPLTNFSLCGIIQVFFTYSKSNGHGEQIVSNFFHKLIKFSNLCTVNDSLPWIHHNFPSLDKIYQHFTLLLVISISIECSLVFNLPAYGWSTNVSYKSWLWVPHITLSTQPWPFPTYLPRNLKGHWHFRVTVTLTSKPSLYFL